jgi:hypothetical protein
MKSEEREDAIWHRLQRLETAYWHDVDHAWGAGAHTFYAANGVFDMGLGSKPHVGRAAIATFYSWRKSRGVRTARHVMSNFHVTVKSERDATLVCIMSLFAADGEPVLPSRPAIMIADVVSDYTLGADNAWQVASRTLRPVFMGGEAPTIMTGN